MAEKIVFKCKCGQKLNVPSWNAGKKTKCPKCSESLVIPGETPNELSSNVPDEIVNLTVMSGLIFGWIVIIVGLVTFALGCVDESAAKSGAGFAIIVSGALLLALSRIIETLLKIESELKFNRKANNL